jgi:putative phage-type endonuclease
MKINNQNDSLTWRESGIGGSDCASILGLSPYKTNVELWVEKCLGTKKSMKGKESVLQRGHDFEPLIIQMFALEHPQFEVTSSPYDLFVHPEYSFLLGSTDARLKLILSGKLGVLEIKYVQIQNAQQRLIWTDSIPDYYYCQILHYLACSGLEFAILKARFNNNNDYFYEKEWLFEKSDHQESIDHLISKEVEFWNKYVLTGIRPPLALPSI